MAFIVLRTVMSLIIELDIINFLKLRLPLTIELLFNKMAKPLGQTLLSAVVLWWKSCLTVVDLMYIINEVCKYKREVVRLRIKEHVSCI